MKHISKMFKKPTKRELFFMIAIAIKPSHLPFLGRVYQGDKMFIEY